MNREDARLLILKSYFSHKTEGFFSITRNLNGSDSSFRQAAAWSLWRDVTILITLRHDVITSWAKRKLPRASSRLWNEPWHEISNNVICATSKDSDQPAHTRCLIRTFSNRLNVLWVLCYWLNIIEIPSLKGDCTGSSESEPTLKALLYATFSCSLVTFP